MIALIRGHVRGMWLFLFIIPSFDTEFRDVNSFMGASYTMRVYANKVSNEIGIDVDVRK